MSNGKQHPATARGSLPQAFRHAGTTYDLAHLRPYDTTFERPSLQGKQPTRFKVAISFSHHCFTKGLPPEGEMDDESLTFAHPNEVRLFDSRRWALSKELPAIVQTLPDLSCQHGNNANFLTVVLMDESGARIEYEIYFRVRKTGPGRLWLNIESAYVRDAEYFGDRPKGRRVQFYIVLHNILNDKPIRP